MDDGARPSDQALVQGTEPQSSQGLGPTGFDPSREFYFFRDEVAGTLAMWAIRQSPYLIPDGLTDAVQAMHDALPDQIGGMFGMTYEQLRQTVEHICLTNPIIAAWNEPKSGHGATMVFSSRYGRPAPDDDFIDLHALAGNICRTLMADQEIWDDEPASGIEARSDATGTGAAERGDAQ